jgi:hypothetical protein
VEVDRLGNVQSSFDLSAVLPDNAIEGVTVDEKGILYLVAEQVQNGALTPIGSQLIVLSPVPEPASAVLTLAGLGLLALAARSRRRR